MRLGAVGLALAMGVGMWQSPIDRLIAGYERERQGEPELREQLPVAVVFRQGRPVAWVSVYRRIEEAPHCGIPSEYIVFSLEDGRVWECRLGMRQRFAPDHVAVLSFGRTIVFDQRDGEVEVRTLR